MRGLFAYTVIGLVTGSVYAIAASGLVLTYTTTGVFNFAHGAIGMFMAFTYWDLHMNHGWPAWLAILVVVGVFAPLMGAVIERVLIRSLQGASTVTSLVVTLGLMVILIGAAQSIWPPANRFVPELLDPRGVHVGGIFVTAHQSITITAAGVVAVAFWWLLNRTRTGIAMRAYVDDRNLTALNGVSPARVSTLSWALGASLAALAGILLAPVLQLDILILTLLVVVAYAAAVVGRLRSLPLTFAGAMILGLAQSYSEWLPTARVPGLRSSIPTIMLFAVLLLLPEARLRGRLSTAAGPRVPTLQRSVWAGGLFVIAAAGISVFLSRADAMRVGQGLGFGIIMLSLVLLTGYGGQVSLCQMTFAGIGAFALIQFGGGGASPVGLIAAAVLAGAVGALVALPALRLQGLYLALATMAFAVMASNLFFSQRWVFGTLGVREVERFALFGSERAFVILLAAAFAAFGVLVLALRRSYFGRVLSAMRDSPTACTTLGLNLTATKLVVFTISAAMAGVGGALFAGLRGVAGSIDFDMLQNLPILLLAVIGGITSVSGALIGGMILALLPVLQDRAPVLGGLVFLATGAAAITLGRNPHGIAYFVSERFHGFLESRRTPPVEPLPSDVEEVSEVAAPAR